MRLLFLVGCAGLAVVLTGCGGGNHKVSGMVTFNDQPLPEGHIAFIPEGSGKGGGGPITNGQFSISAQPGKHKVEITASKLLPFPPGQVGMYGEKEAVRQYLPAQYNAKSELTADIPPSGPLEFKLKGTP